MPRKTDKELLDEALRDGTTIDDILAGARRVTSTRSVADRARSDSAAGAAERRAREGARIGPVIKQTIDAAALPLALLPNPAQPVAGGYLALQGLEGALDDPSVANLSLAALGATPLLRLLRGGAAGAAAVPKGLQKSRYVSERLRQTRPSAGGTTRGDSTSMPTRLPLLSADEQRRQATRVMQRQAGHQPVQPIQPATLADSPTRVSMRALDDITDTADREFMAARPAVPRGFEGHIQGTSGAAARIGESAGGAKQLEALEHLLGREIPPPAGARGTFKAAQGQRPTPDYVHPSDPTGGKFGFDELPEISERELTRLQALFQRLGVR